MLKVARPPQQEVKLHLKYTGPYKVVTKLRPDFYEILDLVQDQTEKVHRNELVKCIHSKPYFFKSKDCKFVKVIQEYLKKHESLRYLLREMMEKKEDLLESTVIHHRPIFLIFK